MIQTDMCEGWRIESRPIMTVENVAKFIAECWMTTADKPTAVFTDMTRDGAISKAQEYCRENIPF